MDGCSGADFWYAQKDYKEHKKRTTAQSRNLLSVPLPLPDDSPWDIFTDQLGFFREMNGHIGQCTSVMPLPWSLLHCFKAINALMPTAWTDRTTVSAPGECDCANCSILFEQCPVGFMLFRSFRESMGMMGTDGNAVIQDLQLLATVNSSAKQQTDVNSEES